MDIPSPTNAPRNLRPFVPSGENYAQAQQFFQKIGFTVQWEVGDVAELAAGEVHFFLQNYTNRELQENLMLAFAVPDLDAYWTMLQTSGVLTEFANVSAKPPTQYPWGREIHLIDPAGVCWHIGEV